MKKELYREDMELIAGLPLPWERLEGAGILLTGATGMIGSFLTEALLFKNSRDHLCCSVYAAGRSMEKLKARFSDYLERGDLHLVEIDVNAGAFPELSGIDYCIHLASNTHPVAYATDPIGTITTNVIGTYHLLEFAWSHHCRRFAFVSSNEIYGENRGDEEFFREDYCGYIDCNTMRAGYPESKRCGEALCQAYIRQKQMDIVIPRLTRSYGPTLLPSDTKALSQFLRKGLAGEDIVLKSEGTQFYSYTYVADAVSGLLTVLLKGECGEAYNVADIRSDIRLRDLAELIARKAGTRVIFDLPDEVEQAGFSKATKARLDSAKLRALGWEARYDIREGISRTMDMMETANKDSR
ncbi:MAG: NAD-dependent epimerase/dehydratase family protein [Sarcina sp.]|nr:NAD-dependent epimerase/dehydratase family protein [Sarcina sp.]